ncbi:immunoglobulin gamma-1 heavy chain-like [Dromiciops gliroides]|uniref:immunoglobulin gamma-1 heavy chain-like n=1 Tax=Dromiciops gliroides TaxID=33562 RepID=UPI001CC53E27|nr:immunoglobulin gamma-1 heavy chain-like [Dromiciops gliroides]
MFTRSPNTLTRACLLELLLSILPGFWAQVRLVETGGRLIHEGQSVTLTCTASGLYFKDFAMSWHRSSVTGGSKEFVASITAGVGSTKDYREDMKGRILIFRKNKDNTVSLTLRQVQKEDSGIYYCASLTVELAQWENFGPGTEVTVLSRDETQLKESGGGLHLAGRTLSLKCQVSGFQLNTSRLGWSLWAPGHAPLWLISLDNPLSETREGHIISSREDTSSQIVLQIKNLSLGDSGKYHCARKVGDGVDTDKLVFGPGTDVTVEPGPRAPLSPSVFLVRSQDAVACLVSDFFPKELHVSLASPRASVSAQALTVAPTAHGTYSAIQIGRVGENDSVTCSVQHLGKETLVSYQPDTGITPQLEPSFQDKELTAGEPGPEQENQVFLKLLGLRLLLIKTMAINTLFTTMTLIF